MAATVVALAHFRPPLPYDLAVFLLWQNAAVDLFFCLSGFTLSYVYKRRTFRFSGYLTARIARVYPLYLVTLIAAGALYVWPLMINPLTYPAGTALSDFFRQALMLNARPIVGSGVHWNFPAWSISIEWFCYLVLFPLLLTQNAPRSTAARLICIIALSIVSYRLFMAYFDEHITSPELYTAKSQWSYWVSLIRGMCGFIAGWLAFASYEQRDKACHADLAELHCDLDPMVRRLRPLASAGVSFSFRGTRRDEFGGADITPARIESASLPRRHLLFNLSDTFPMSSPCSCGHGQRSIAGRYRFTSC